MEPVQTLSYKTMKNRKIIIRLSVNLADQCFPLTLILLSLLSIYSRYFIFSINSSIPKVVLWHYNKATGRDKESIFFDIENLWSGFTKLWYTAILWKFV